MFAFFWVKILSCFPLSPFLLFKNLSILQGEWDFSKKRKRKTDFSIFMSQNLFNYVAQHNWTDVWLNIFRVFWTFSFSFFFFFFRICWNHNFYCVFSKSTFIAPKIGTLFVNTTALTDVVSFIFCIFFCFCCVRLLFFLNEKKNKFEHRTTKKETKPQDANEKTT